MKSNDGEAVDITMVDHDDSCADTPEGQSATGSTPSGGRAAVKPGRLTMAVLQADIRELSKNMNNRLELLQNSCSSFEDKFEQMQQKLNESIAEVIAKTVKREVDKLKTSLNVQLDAFDTRMCAVEETQQTVDVRIEGLEEKVDQINDICQIEEDRKLNIVLFGVPQAEYENVENKVNAVIKEGLKLTSITVQKAERKINNRSTAPGVIVARCRSKADKDNIMKNKSKLRLSTVYKKVMVDSDKSIEQRQAENNARVLAKVFHDKLKVKGSKLSQNKDEGGERVGQVHSEQGR
jgi:chaperonin cofactor prefoldin